MPSSHHPADDHRPSGGAAATNTTMDSIMSSSCRFPISLQFIDIRYRIKLAPGGGKLRSMLHHPTTTATTIGAASGEERTILKGVTGTASPGEMLAVLGPSGSGKSTLLSVLAGRLSGKHTGAVLANGSRPTRSVARRTGFVTQDDLLYPHLTVRETLVFCAMLRLPASLSKNDKVAAAEAAIAELGLGRCADTRVGSAFVRGVSGGERKRVSIAHEMLTGPSVLLLDEPTSGLDSTAAGRLVSALGAVAARGRTVVAAVHQPSSRVFQMFDSVLLLAEGSCLYFGPAREAMDYFGSVGFAPRFHVNPADFMLDLANGYGQIIDHQGDPEKANVKQALLSSYNKSLAPRVKACVHAAASAAAAHTGGQKSSEKEQKDCSRIGWFSQFTILLHRGLKQRRHEAFQTLRVSQVIAAALLAGSMWWHSSIHNVQDRLGLLFFIVIFWGVFASFNAVFAFPQDRAIFIKERASGMYTLSTYFMARMAGDLPMELVLPTVFTVILYWMAGLRPELGAFMLTLVILLSYVLVAQGLGLALGAAIMDAKQASTLATVTMLAFLLTGGFYVQHVPAGLTWVKYTSFTFYCYRLLINVQYGEREMASYQSSFHQTNRKGTVNMDMGGERNTVTSIAVLILMFVGYRIFAYAALRRIKS